MKTKSIRTIQRQNKKALKKELLNSYYEILLQNLNDGEKAVLTKMRDLIKEEL